MTLVGCPRLLTLFASTVRRTANGRLLYPKPRDSPRHGKICLLETSLQKQFLTNVVISNEKILIIKPTRFINFSNLFWNETLHVSDSSSAHHQELLTVHSAMVYVIQVCRQLSSRISLYCCCCSKAVYKPVWHIPLLSVQWVTPDDGQMNSETCRVSFPK
jgi:hypothetical protein